ncbi:MAG: PP0621 family protein [Gammaproteobacteria bacterium]|nr:PP0621 family protein [Gammaproteobacteria bacterium]
MGIIRLITVVAVIWLVWFFVKRFQQNLVERKQAAEKKAEIKAAQSEPLSSVKKCAVCGIHVPENETVVYNGRYYCSDAHKNSDSAGKNEK